MNWLISKVNTITVWISLGIVMTLLISMATSARMIQVSSKHVIEESNLSQISYLLLSLKSRVELDIIRDDIERTHHDISVMGTIPEVLAVAVSDESGRIIVANRQRFTKKPISALSQLTTTQERAQARRLKTIQFYESPDRKTMEAILSFAMPSPNELRSTRRGLVFIRYDLSLAERKLEKYMNQEMTWLWSGGFFLLFIIIVFIKKYLLSPVSSLVKQASALTQGDYTRQLVAKGCIEFVVLAEAFDLMRKTLLSKITELEQIAEVLEFRVNMRTSELQNANVAYKQAQNMAKLGLWEINLETLKCNFSPEACEIMGILKEKIQRPEQLFAHVENNSISDRELIQIILDKNVPITSLNLQVSLAGHRRYIRLMAEKISSPGVNELKVIGIVQDVTEQKKKEQSLFENQARMQAIIDTAADAIIVIDTAGIIEEFSPAAELIFGYSKEDVLGKNVKMLMPDPDHSQHDQYLTNYYRTGIQKVVNNKREVTARRKDGTTFPIDLAVVETRIGTAVHFTALIRDITYRKESEMKLVNAMEEAQSATRAKSAFLANMSHEIRTPMNAIIGLSHLALTDINPQKIKDYLSKINRSAKSLLCIINDVLDLSKIEAGKLELENTKFRLEDVIEYVQAISQIKAEEKRLNLSFDVASDVPTALIGDSLKIAQILLNLINNAIKFTPEYGKVTALISTTATTIETSELLFSISDNGIGIPDVRQGRLFHAFSQADASTTRKFGGTGLGLVICKNMVQIMGGEIGFNSTEGQGSTFFFTLTLDRQQGKPSPRMSVNLIDDTKIIESIKQINNLRVLLVEDNDFNQEIVEELLERAGINVVVASNGQEALALLEQECFDLVLMDCQMPVMDGYEATEAIRSIPALKDLPVIALTANVMKADVDLIRKCGMNDYLAKPLDIDLLYNKIHHWLKDKTIRRDVSRQLPEQPDIKLHFSNINEINIDVALKHVRHDISILKRMYGKFKESQNEFGNNVRVLISQVKMTEAAREAHTLKGQAGYLGLTGVVASSGHLELCIKEARNDVEDAVQQVELQLERVFSTFDSYFN